MKRALLLFLIPLHLLGVTLEEIGSKPTSRAKDFLIWQFLRGSVTPDEASEAFYQLSYVTPRFLHMYAKKCSEEAIIYTSKCLKSEPLHVKEDRECLRLSITPYKLSKLSKEQLQSIKPYADERAKKWIEFLQKGVSYSAIQGVDATLFFTLFRSVSRNYRHSHFNISLPYSYLKRVRKARGFDTFVAKVVTDRELDKLQYSLAKLQGVDDLRAQTLFFLGINALRYGEKESARAYLSLAKERFYFRMDRDKATFWLYLLSEDKTYLQDLSASKDINIYSLYAKELLHVEVTNYFTSVEHNESAPYYDFSDPFVYKEALDEMYATPKEGLKELAKRYSHRDAVAFKAYLLQRSSGSTIHNFIHPYDHLMKDFTLDDKALIYAIMRQESHFIPSALSYSYALGVMQLMPFLVDALNSGAKEKIDDYFDMFKPEYNIAFGYRHIQTLKRSLYHPLFIAYSYNGGLGFFKRHLLKSEAFRAREYEPFLSLELMENSQSREYGKKVLANYVIYKRILGDGVSIVTLFETLNQPDRCDRFRARL